jgi:cobalt-precorrin 5A hydrolase
MSEPAIVALTPGGLNLARRLAQALGRGQPLFIQDSARSTLENLFRGGRPLVCIMALGIVVRILGPLAQNKDTDPPVVVVDEAGRFAISVLGGHGAGANELARQVAAALGAVPVITTASEALALPAVDLIGRDWGWKIEQPENLTRVAAAVIRGENIGVWQTVGRRDWWQPFGSWPPTFQTITTWPPEGNWAGLLVISDRQVSVIEHCPTLIYRPPTLVLGVGCRRGVPCAEIEGMFQDLCRTQRLAPLSLGAVATAAIKAGEPGLQEFARHHEVPLVSFGIDELARVAPLPTPSETVKAKIGIYGVAEPAAILAAGTTTLIVPKCRGQRITMAVARKEEA